ncbi:HAMP domain-containing sensor histidine kinase [Sulfitobacter sp. D35]|uniref:sensor histidine kinase n=1 Tax=Sulfitobacter sp. D35 TaxID=3083252 RepID=UPI00296FC5D7|nr:HAMP domain-containing sensor histidine kinase [Sulfitobacter sp. D35]MDW4497104.1 HAMP domain-containing sensor histidine kinase [Sulfitobacter sp. D35]
MVRLFATRAVEAAPPPRPGPIVTRLSSRELEELIYLISHDVRASVRALIEVPQWICEDLEEAGIKINDSMRENIDLMNRHTGRLDRMLVDLLTYSRVGRMQDVHEIDLDTALTEVLEEISVPAGFSLVRAFDCRHVYMGERDVLTLLSALVTNAVRHHDRDSGKVIVSAHQARGEILLRVRDNGPGIPEPYREKVFEAMSTLRPRDEVEGSGMGLAIVRKIALLYGGTASVRDNADSRGTVVEVCLPRTRGET